MRVILYESAAQLFGAYCLGCVSWRSVRSAWRCPHRARGRGRGQTADTGDRSAILHTMVENIRQGGGAPFAYLKDVLPRLPAMASSRMVSPPSSQKPSTKVRRTMELIPWCRNCMIAFLGRTRSIPGVPTMGKPPAARGGGGDPCSGCPEAYRPAVGNLVLTR